MRDGSVLEKQLAAWVASSSGRQSGPELTVDLGHPLLHPYWRDQIIEPTGLTSATWEPENSDRGCEEPGDHLQEEAAQDPTTPGYACSNPDSTQDEASQIHQAHHEPGRTHPEPGRTHPEPGRTHPEPGLHPTIAELRDVGRDRSILDAAMLASVREIADVIRDRVLDRRDWVGLDLNRTQTRALQADTKRATITEVQHSLGFTVAEATTLASLAMTGSAVVDLATDALRRGEVTWAQVRRFWESAAAPSRDLSAEQRELVAEVLFGTMESLAAVERFDEAGTLRLGTPWARSDFDAALEREVTACEGSDVASERAKRQRAHKTRKVRIRVHDDGTATLVVRGPAVTLLGIHERYDHVARNLRAGGHEHTLDQLVVDAMLAVLGHGRLDLPEPESLAELSATALDDLIAVVNGAPRIALQVIVPLDALTHGHPNLPSFDPAHMGDRHPAPSRTADRKTEPPHAADPPVASPDDEVADVSDEGRPFDQEHRPPPGWASPDPPEPPSDQEHRPPPDRGSSDQEHRPPPDRGFPDQEHRPPPDRSSSDREAARETPQTWAPLMLGPGETGYDSRLRRGRGLVAEVRGTFPFFITAGYARELFFFPGTTLHRVVTDTLDGRLVERTISTYRPDADMRRQVKAADVYSRAPFSRLSGRSLEIDHVIPYGTEPGGVTGELNLADLDKRNHKIKTIGDLRLFINERRDLTFTTLLGQVSGSRVHDYNQYLRAAHPDDIDERRDLANRVVYALLAADPQYQRRPARDDWLTLDHTDADSGQRRPGPPPHPEDAHTLLGINDEPDEE